MAEKSSPDMYFDELQLKQVDYKSRDTVFGFIRNSQIHLTTKETSIKCLLRFNPALPYFSKSTNKTNLH